MNLDIAKKIAKYLILAGLAVIVFSPLYLKTNLFFPFIVTKTIAFNISVEIMFLAFLFLAWKDKNYRIRINTVIILFGVYILLSFISSILGDNFYRSFWSNNERSEGLLLYLHLFAFLVVLTGFLRKMKDWLLLLDLSFLASAFVALVALGQHFKVDWILASSGGQRLAGTIGNAGYMAGYLIFAIFFGAFLFTQRKDIRIRFYYGAVMLLEFFIVLYTETRGGMIALAFGVFVFLMYLLFFYFNSKKLKTVGVVIILLSILLPVLLFSNKESDFVKNTRPLSRISNISMSDTTAQNRLMTWGSAWQGFKDRPILGWGAENFYQPFDRYFNPAIYRHAGSIIWFDRAHNIIFDRLITGGILGLLTYLSLLFLPLYYLWRYFIKKAEGDKKKLFIPLVFTLLIVSYFIQNLFIFEALAIYIPLFISLSFVGLFCPFYNIKALERNNVVGVLFFVFAVLFIPIFYFVNVKPIGPNLQVSKALGGSGELSAEQRFKILDSALSVDTYGDQEYRQQYFNFFQKIFMQYFSSEDKNIHKVLSDIADKLEVELNKQIEENPYNFMNYIILMKFNNMAYIYNPNRLNNNIEVYNKAIGLSNTRAQLYTEGGQTYLTIGLYYRNNNEMGKAEVNFNLAIEEFKKAIQLNDQNPEPYRNIVNALASMEKYDEAIRYANEAKKIERYGNATWADEMIEKIIE